MGAECPNGHGRQNIVRNITADGDAPRKPEDIVARKLACGCVIGNREFKRFQEAVTALEQERAEKALEIDEWFADQKAAAYKSIVVRAGDTA